MELIMSFAALVGGGEVDALGSADWRDREAAECRLRAHGWLAVPFMLRGESSDNPEVRERVRGLLTPWRSFREDCRAWDVILNPWPPDFWAYFWDVRLRQRVRKVAIAAGWQWSGNYWEDPGECEDWLLPDQVDVALNAIRQHFGNPGPGWPFTR